MTEAQPREARGRAWLEECRAEALRAQARSSGIETRWSWTRLLVAVAVVVAWLFATTHFAVTLGVTVGGIVVFALAVRRHHAALAERELADQHALVCDEALRRVDGAVVCTRDWRRPGDDADEDAALEGVLAPGPTWALTDQERDDLDLFAPPVGVFGQLNGTSTPMGARRLRDLLEAPSTQPEVIAGRQRLVRRLAEEGAARLKLMAGLALLRNEERRLGRFVRAVAGQRPLALPLPVVALRIWSLVCLGVVAFSVAQTAQGAWLWLWGLVGVAAVNGLLRQQVAGACVAAIAPWRGLGRVIERSARALEIAGRELPDDTLLGELRSACTAVEPAVLRRLNGRVGWADSGGAIWTALNYIALADVHLAIALTDCIEPRQAAMRRALGALGELDAWLSLGAFAAQQPDACFPSVARETCLDIRRGRHPLIGPEVAVPNDVRLDAQRRMWVITGSNMAGKSTFLRMVGVNVVLAQVGSAVTATGMTWSPVRLLTDLRARDDLAQRESYFLAEVRHLRRMVKPPAGEATILGLIDEPFRGTNSHDQSAASVAVVRHLLTTGHLFLLATHDHHLTRLADGEVAQNRHFRENLAQGALVFDYLLREGPATTRNALDILEMEGYPAALVQEARAWLGDEASPPAEERRAAESPKEGEEERR